jgi:superfamily II DNA or RNA helicase
MGFVLRPYQDADIATLRARFAAGARRICYQAPTGSGKTFLFAHIVASAGARGNRVGILGHRIEIVLQIHEMLDELGVAHGLIASGFAQAPELPVQVCMVQTLVWRRHQGYPAPDLLVIDEAHHAAAKTWRKIIDAYPQAKILGTTATPQRLDGKGLSDIFDELVIGPSITKLIEQGFLSPVATFAPARSPDLSGIKTRAGDYEIEALAKRMSKAVIITTAVDEYVRLCAGAPAIAFCVDIKHSELTAEAFRARGFRAAHVDGETPMALRRSMIRALGTGELQVLTNCELVSEGLDVPTVVAAILLRPTQSVALHLQQVGRAIRPAPGKERALILDHAGNTFKFGPPDADRRWCLEGKLKGETPMQRCSECGALVPLAADTCPECSAVLRGRPAAGASGRMHVERHGAALVEINKIAAMSYGRALRWARDDKTRLRLVAQARGYKPGWVWHRLREIREALDQWR